MPWKPGGERKKPAALADRSRGTSHERGYDRHWARFRAVFIAKYPLCADCIEQNVVVLEPTTEVHHVQKLRDRPDLRLVESNCLGLCGRHHRIRTSRGE